MFRLAALIFPIAGTSLAGILVIAALVAGFDEARGIVSAAAVGALLGLPVSWGIARAILARG